MTNEELIQKSRKQWDGYRTISKTTAARISTTGKAPKPGYEVKAKIKWPAQVCTVKGTNEKVWCEEKEMWIGWTHYDGKKVLYIY